jgi:NADH-quinone oxidoreductase subunit A
LREPYVPLLVLFAVVGALVASMVALSVIFGPKQPRAAKSEVFECGSRPAGPAHQRSSIRFYMVALLFLLFDIEAVFLFPWAVVYRDLGLFGLVEMTAFVGILGVGLVYVFKRGALEWD